MFPSEERQVRRIMEAIEVGMVKWPRAKREEIEKIRKLNWALEEIAKSPSCIFVTRRIKSKICSGNPGIPGGNRPGIGGKRGNAGGVGTCARPVAAHAAISSSENIASTSLDMVIGKPGTLTFALYQKRVS
ncbi:unnamed protein product [Prunus armeniaca]|uniref:Uncharacterized protein n=1 Tax=Prunus armeniaca TaxID=36596 RepID=A0A6J5USL6_PRUAR|nr:unnamed protein product [Prunus armeniaca]